MNCSLDSFRTRVRIYPVSKICNVPLLTNLSTIITGLLAIDLVLCVLMRERILIGSHKNESEEREFRIHFEGMRRGGADRRETVEEEMKVKERDITSDVLRAQESKFP